MQCDTIWYSQYSQDSANFCFLQSAGCDWGFRCSIFLDHVFVGETPATNVQPKPCSRDLPVAHRLKVRGVPARGALESTALTCASLQGSLAWNRVKWVRVPSKKEPYDPRSSHQAVDQTFSGEVGLQFDAAYQAARSQGQGEKSDVGWCGRAWCKEMHGMQCNDPVEVHMLKCMLCFNMRGSGKRWTQGQTGQKTHVKKLNASKEETTTAVAWSPVRQHMKEDTSLGEILSCMNWSIVHLTRASWHSDLLDFWNCMFHDSIGVSSGVNLPWPWFRNITLVF